MLFSMYYLRLFPVASKLLRIFEGSHSITYGLPGREKGPSYYKVYEYHGNFRASPPMPPPKK